MGQKLYYVERALKALVLTEANLDHYGYSSLPNDVRAELADVTMESDVVPITSDSEYRNCRDSAGWDDNSIVYGTGNEEVTLLQAFKISKETYANEALERRGYKFGDHVRATLADGHLADGYIVDGEKQPVEMYTVLTCYRTTPIPERTVWVSRGNLKFLGEGFKEGRHVALQADPSIEGVIKKVDRNYVLVFWAISGLPHALQSTAVPYDALTLKGV